MSQLGKVCIEIGDGLRLSVDVESMYHTTKQFCIKLTKNVGPKTSRHILMQTQNPENYTLTSLPVLHGKC